MRYVVRMMIAACVLAPMASQAAVVWSACQTITAVTNEPASSAGSSILLTLSPGVSGCSAQGVTGATEFFVGQDGVIADNMNGFLASSLAAFSVGKQVLVAYDNGSSNCYSTAISLGGYLAQCP
jgi:hypothetical protein